MRAAEREKLPLFSAPSARVRAAWHLLPSIAAPGKPAHVLVRSRLTGQSGIGRTATAELRPAGDSVLSMRVFLTRLVGFVPWRVDSVVQLAGAAR